MTNQNPKQVKRVKRTTTTREAAPAAATTSTAYQTEDHIGQEAWIGTGSDNVSNGNVSWGAIFAGVVTFLGIMILLGVGAAAMGLQGSSGIATGIFALISLAVAFAAAGYVSGALGVRAGLFHGFATWATSLIASLILAGWLGASVIGGVGSLLGSAGSALGAAAGTTVGAAGEYASQNVTRQELEDAINEARNEVQENVNVTQEDIDNAKQQANEMADDAARKADEISDQAAVGTWWTFAGLIIGAVIASLAGAAGARSVLNRDDHQQIVRK
ncbi:hypothetical protein M5J20_05285 [Corynebacterium sp. TA-R-1]|uniref:Uncharacterized protein n=1 Tax=Corynebacterium stercoris TaxID=2943490 RepID=A0ABT1G0R8_9CORY|nr:hypothetical protein [Corynebacterium stercoris]MCP1387600.1 hypothetical protein [Corynebacterium stercoris]